MDIWILGLRFLKSQPTNLTPPKTGVEKKHPTNTTPSPNPSAYTTSLTVAEARQHFYDKVEQAIRLALSKFARVHVGRSLFGKIGLGSAEPQPPTCACCNRAFPSHNASGAAAACAFPPSPLYSRQATAAAAARASGAGAGRAMRPTVSSTLRPAVSLELDASSSSSSQQRKPRAGSNNSSAIKPALRPTTGALSRQATYSAVDEILKDYNNGGRSGSGGGNGRAAAVAGGRSK